MLGGSYTFVISNDVKDISGNTLSTNQSLSFYMPFIYIKMNYGSGDWDVTTESKVSGNGERYYAFPILPSVSFVGTQLGLGFNCTARNFRIYDDNSSSPGSLLSTYHYHPPGTGYEAGEHQSRAWNTSTSIKDNNGTSYTGHASMIVNLGDSGFTFSANTKYWVVWYSESGRCGDGSYGADSGSWPFSTHKYSTDGSTWNGWSRSKMTRITIVGK